MDAEKTGDQFGVALPLIDLDGDGVDKLAVSAPWDDDVVGAIYLLRNERLSDFRPWRRLGRDALQTAPFSTVGILINTPDPDMSSALERFTDLSPGVKAPLTYAYPSIDSAAMNTVVLDVNLDGDGVIDRIVGAPPADRGKSASGVVIIPKGKVGDGNETTLSNWNWFGQSYYAAWTSLLIRLKGIPLSTS